MTHAASTSGHQRTPSRARRLLHPVPHPVVNVVIGVVGIILITLWGFAVKKDTSGYSFDESLNSHHNALWDFFGHFFTDLVAPAEAIIIGIIYVAIVTWVARSLSVGLVAGLTTALSWLSSDVVKYIVHRPRPDYALLPHHLSFVNDTDPSFPSGHVVFVISLTMSLLLILRGSPHRSWVWIPGLALAVAVAFARMYVGAHYPDDVLAAGFYGIFGALVAFPILTWLASLGDVIERVDGLVARWLPKDSTARAD